MNVGFGDMRRVARTDVLPTKSNAASTQPLGRMAAKSASRSLVLSAANTGFPPINQRCRSLQHPSHPINPLGVLDHVSQSKSQSLRLLWGQRVSGFAAAAFELGHAEKPVGKGC